MNITVDKININAEVLTEGKKEFLFLLHGFTGCSDDWRPLASEFHKSYNIIAVDLVGHGKSSAPADLVYYSPDDICTQLFQVIRSFTHKQVAVLGYSMGGRAALNFAVKFPEQIKGLILEGASAGIRNEREKSDRIKKDFELADYIEKNSLEQFVNYWMSLEIFATQQRFSNGKLEEIKKSKVLKNNPSGLANCLRGFSSGIMPPLYSKLRKFDAPTLLISGELDSRFTLINSKMASLFHNARHIIVKNAGHNTHLEEPERFIKAVNHFLKLLA